MAAPAPRALPPETETKIRALLAAPELQAGHVGVLISALGTAVTPQAFPAAPYDDKTQPVLFAVDADKRFTPASNMKLFTAAMALKVLGPEKTFATRVLKHKIPDNDEPDLILLGGGDPSLDDDGLRDCARQVAATGVKTIGAILGDGALFSAETLGARYPDGWTLDDTLWYYGPEISALAYNRNQLDVKVTGRDKSGQEARVEIKPNFPKMQVSGSITTGNLSLKGKSEDELIHVERTFNSIGEGDSVVISGSVAPLETLTFGVAMPSPWQVAAQAFAAQMKPLGIETITCTVTERDESFLATGIPEVWKNNPEIARHESPPLRELMKRLLKNSDNLYAEMILRDAALESLKPAERKRDTNYAQRGHELIKNWLKENGMATDGLNFTDGSGLSRYDLVTPRAVAGVLASVEKVPGADAFWNALPIAGVDGTMKNRCKGTLAENNARAKSGTFSIVSCLSGYVTTQNHQRLSVVILTNFVPDGTAASRRMQDAVFSTLAEARF